MQEVLQALNETLPGRATGGSETTRVLRLGEYALDDLLAVAEVAHHYLFSGGAALARTLFHGLAAIAPREPYFALGLGLAHDHMGHGEAALHWYQRAAKLDPMDPRADINQAELYVRSGELERATLLLTSGRRKAEVRGEAELETKATALLHHLQAQNASFGSRPMAARANRASLGCVVRPFRGGRREPPEPTPARARRR